MVVFGFANWEKALGSKLWTSGGVGVVDLEGGGRGPAAASREGKLLFTSEKEY